MKTWDEYKDYVRATDTSAGKDIDEIESLSMIVGAIVEKRTELGLSQRKLAEICGIPQSSIARIESFKTTPNLDTLFKLMQPLGLRIVITPV